MYIVFLENPFQAIVFPLDGADFKKLEMSLRDIIPQLELIRREMPFKYGFHVVSMIDFVRDSRTKALDHLFDDSLVPNASN